MSDELDSVREQSRSSDCESVVYSEPRRLSATTGGQPMTARLWSEPCVWLCGANFVIRTVVAATFPLLEEEARLWELSRFPAWGYTDQMPLVAWLIRLCSTPWETPEPFTVRLPALILGSVWPVLVYVLALTLFENRRVARWSLILSLCLPVLSCVGIVTLAETPLVVFHLLLLLVLWKALQGDGGKYWYLAGVLLGLAVLSKLNAILALAGIGVYLGLSVEHRRWLRRIEPYGALGVAAVVISPWLFWQHAHDASTFRYVLQTQLPDRLDGLLGNLAEVCAEQLAHTTPFLLVPVLGCLVVTSSWLPDHLKSAYRFTRVQSLCVIGFYFLAGACVETHPHWTLLAYPPAVICLAALFCYNSNHWLVSRLKLLTVVTAVTLFVLSVLAATVSHLLPHLEKRRFGQRFAGKLEQTEQELFGWREVETQLSQQLEACTGESQPLLFTCGYKTANLVSFHHAGPLVIDLAPLSVSADSPTNLQRDYIDYQALVGRGGVFFEDFDRSCTGPLREGFQDAIELRPIQVLRGDQVVKHFRVFCVRGFKPSAAARLSSR